MESNEEGWFLRERMRPHPTNLDAFARLVTGLRFFENWVGMDAADYRHYDVDAPAGTFQPDELIHRLFIFDENDSLTMEWGWWAVPTGHDKVVGLTMYLLDDLLSHDRNELTDAVLCYANGLDWLARLYGLVQHNMDGNGTYAPKVNDEYIVEQLRPYSFYFNAMKRLPTGEPLAKPSEPLRTINQAMILKRLKLRYSAKEQVAHARSTISTWVKKDDFPKCMTWSKVRQWILDNKHVDIGEP